jgi:hypothetical protein
LGKENNMAPDFIDQTNASEKVAPFLRNTALFMGVGSTTQPFSTAAAGKNFLGFWFESKATTVGSDSRGMYLRLYLNGATTGGGEALRPLPRAHKHTFTHANHNRYAWWRTLG